MKFSKSINKTALKLIDELGLTIAQVAKIVGTGKDGVILKADVDAYTTGKFVERISKAKTGGSMVLFEYEEIPTIRFRVRDALCGLRQMMGPAGRLEVYSIDAHYFSSKPVAKEERPVPAEHVDDVIVGEQLEVS